jgi:hypothetical protein
VNLVLVGSEETSEVGGFRGKQDTGVNKANIEVSQPLSFPKFIDFS